MECSAFFHSAVYFLSIVKTLKCNWKILIYLNIIYRVFGLSDCTFVFDMSIHIYVVFCRRIVNVVFVVVSFTIRPPSVSLARLSWAI